MATIDDFKPGTSYIYIYKHMFKYANDFEAICKFLKLPEGCKIIKFHVEEGSYSCVSSV